MKAGLVRLALSSGALFAPAAAWGQEIGDGSTIAIDPELDRDDVAGARAEPAYHPKPILVGPVFAQAGLTVVGEYESNVFNRPTGKDDAVMAVQPSLLLRANLPRHELKVNADGVFRRFAHYTSENSDEFDLGTDGRLDFGTRQAVIASVHYTRLVEPRSSAGTIANADEPVSYNRFTAGLGTRVEFGKFRLLPSVDYQKLDFAPVSLAGGGEVDQGFRDTRRVRGEARVEYDLAGLVSAFAAGSYGDVNSTAAPAGQERDSHSFSVVGGLKGTLSPVISGEAAVGYEKRNYKLPQFRDFGGPTYRVDLQWFVTPLVTLRAQANRDFRNSGNRDVAGILTDEFRLSAYYDPLRNLRVSATTAIQRDRYRDTNTNAWRKSMRVQANYRLNRHLAVGSYVAFLRQDVTGAPIVNEFSALRVGLGLTITP